MTEIHVLSTAEQAMAEQLTQILLAPTNSGRRHDRRQKRGRFDPKSVMRSEYNDDGLVFKQKVEIAQEEPLSVMINIDNSYSMTDSMLSKAESIAAILLKAFKDAGHKVVVVLYSGEARIVEEVPQLHHEGVTDMLKALKLDDTIVGSEAGSRLIINIHDSELFVEQEECRNWLTAFHHAGGNSLGIHIVYTKDIGEEHVICIREVKELIPKLIETPLLSERYQNMEVVQ